MEQATFPIYKSKAMRPFLYSHLATSTPDSHQISKRIKGLLGCSEHYKGNRVDYPNVGPSFSPLRSRDYRKARELTLEIWDPMVQASFLERFLKLQKNLQIIRMKILTKKEYKGRILKRLCGVLSKNDGLTRVHIDFDEEQTNQVKPKSFSRMRSMRKLPRLKNFEVTLDGEQAYPFSTNLIKAGFDGDNGFAVKDKSAIQKLIQKAIKFHHLDTLKIGIKPYAISTDQFTDGLLLVISKLFNFRELHLDYFKDSGFSLQQTFRILDYLTEAPKFEILRLGFPILGEFQISLLNHPLFKKKSLKRTSFSLVFYHTSENLGQILDLFGEIPSLYELSLRFIWQSEIADGEMEKISRMTSVRKLKIVLDHSSITLSRKQGGGIFRSILKMYWLEELDLQLPRGCLELNLGNTQGLPRLKKASFSSEKWRSEGTKDLLAIMEILGKCHQLRELKLDLGDSLHDHQGVTMKLIESLRKLKRLEVFNFDATTLCRSSNMTMDLFEDFVMTCHQLRNLQDLTIRMVSVSLSSGYPDPEVYQRCQNLLQRFSTNKKYRHFDLACVH